MLSLSLSITSGAFREMINEAHKRKFDILLVWKLDRLSRSLKDLINTLDELGEDYIIKSFEPIIRPKVETTYIQSCFLKNADVLIDECVNQMRKQEINLNYSRQIKSLKDKSIDDIKAMTNESVAFMDSS